MDGGEGRGVNKHPEIGAQSKRKNKVERCLQGGKGSSWMEVMWTKVPHPKVPEGEAMTERRREGRTQHKNLG